MPRAPFDLAPGLIGDDTSYAGKQRWRYGSNFRFVRGKPQIVGGHESVTADLLTGVCRWIYPWSGASSQLSLAFGTHSRLQVWVGGELYDITPSGLAAGQIDGTGGTGYGTGGYGTGGYGEPSSTDYFPRTWSGGAWGKQLIASPRGDTIYNWQNNTASLATALSNAPDNVTYCLVAPQDQVFALGCNEESGGTFNPLCIRHSSVRNNNEWNTAVSTTAREYILPGGGRLVAGAAVGNYLLVWTDQALFLGTYVGALDQVWRFDRVGLNCGLIGPNAFAIKGQTAIWFSTDRQFRSYSLGGEPKTLPCPIRSNMDEYLASSQMDKVVASTCAQWGEVRFDYPDSRDGYENSRYLSIIVEGPDSGAWSKGEQARTAFVDAGPSQHPCATTYAGNIYWHERGTSADGAVLSGYIESGDLEIDVERTAFVRCIWPDIHEQAGAWSLTVYSRQTPQGEETEHGPYTLAPDVEKYDLRISGRFLRLKFSFESSPAAGRLGSPVFDLTLAGRR